MKRYIKFVLLIAIDALAINFAYILSFLIRFEFDVESNIFNGYFQVYLSSWLALTVLKLLVYWCAGLYNSLWRYAGTEEIFRIGISILIATSLSTVYFTLSGKMIPRGVYIICLLLDLILMSAIRLSYRYFRDLRNPGSFNLPFTQKGRLALYNRTNVMVIGAGNAGATMIKEINNNHPELNKRVVVVVDDDPLKQNKRIAGVKVAGGRNSIVRLARKYGINEIIITVPSANKKAISEIVNECNKTRCSLKILPGLVDLINETVSVSKLRDVDIEDLLGRDTVEVMMTGIAEYISGKIIMVTGAGGSIGSELCKQIAEFRPRKIVAFDIYENTLFELGNEINEKYPVLDFETMIGSVRNEKRIREVYEKHKPHVVFHAAAHKHVPLMEANPKEAIINNIFGTKTMVDLADEYAVEKFILISTDKAVNPTSVMGATKRAAEMILQDKSYTSRTKYAAVRFGNVLGSNGSVIPTFRRQIAAGGPVTVTHKDVTRYFMTIQEAVQLVIQAGALAAGGEIFLLDMGEPVKIYDLAENVIRLSGYTPGVDIDIKITGLRPGEKLFEELLLAEEGIQTTDHSKIFMGHQVPPSDAMNKLLHEANNESLENIKQSVEVMTVKEAKAWLREIVPNYDRS